MYELCWSYHGFASKKDGTWKTPLVEVSEIRTMWQIEDSKYPMMSDFKKRVFDVAKKEINDYENSQFTVEKIEDVKQGKKIIGWYFHCKLKGETRSKLSLSSSALNREDDSIARDHQQEVLQLFKTLISSEEIKNSENRIERENQALEEAKQTIISKYRE